MLSCIEQNERLLTSPLSMAEAPGSRVEPVGSTVTVVKIEVYADILCPWCYLSKRTMEAAMRRHQLKHPKVNFEVVWRPFYLYPNLKKGCEKISLYQCEAGPEKFQTLLAKLQDAGRRHGITFSFDGRSGPSRNAHKLAAQALQTKGVEVQGRVVEALFRGHFEAGRDASDLEWLTELGMSVVGLPAMDVRGTLQNEVAGWVVDEEVRYGTDQAGVEAVPCVTVLGRYRLGGYQEEAVFEELFDKIQREGLTSD